MLTCKATGIAVRPAPSSACRARGVPIWSAISTAWIAPSEDVGADGVGIEHDAAPMMDRSAAWRCWFYESVTEPLRLLVQVEDRRDIRYNHRGTS